MEKSNNGTPIANDDSAWTREGHSVRAKFLQNDKDPSGDMLTVLSFSQPSDGFMEYSEYDKTVVYVHDEGLKVLILSTIRFLTVEENRIRLQ